MIITDDQPGYEMEYVYGGAGLFTPVAKMFNRVVGKAGQRLLKSTAKKIASDVGKKFLDAGSKKAEQLARDKIKSLLNRKQSKRNLRISNTPAAASVELDTPNFGIIPRRRGLNEGLGIKII